MELFIPGIGTILQLNQDWQFTLYNEYRNSKLFSILSLNYSDGPKLVDLPSGLILKIDRIYLRKGSSQFSSITFSIPKVKTKSDKLKYKSNVILGGGKFWVKLHECNGTNMSPLESNILTVESVREIYNEMETDVINNKDSPFKNTTNFLMLFNRYLGNGVDLNNLYTNLSLDIFLDNMVSRMEKLGEKNLETFKDKFKKFNRDLKLKKLLGDD